MKMRRASWLLFNVAILQTEGTWPHRTPPEPTLSERSYKDARRVLDQAVEAFGGAAGLQAARRFRVVQSGLRYQLFQNDDPELPWLGWKLGRTAAVDLDAGKLYGEYRVEKPSPSYVWWTREFVDGAKGWELIMTKKWAVPMLEPGVESMRDFVRLLPQSLLIEALESGASLRAMGVDRLEGRPQDVVGFTTESGQRLALSFDLETHLLTRYESLYTRNTVGDTVNETRFSGYRKAGGFPVPGRLIQHNAGYLATDATYDEVELGRPPEEALFEVPSTFARLRVFDAKPELSQLAPGVYLVHGLSGGFNSMFVVFEDFIAAVEAPEENSFRGISEQAIAMIKKAVPGKPIRHLIETHHHGDHSAGARAYIAEGATVVTTPGNKAYLERVAAAPYRMRPDALARNPRPARIETIAVGGKRVIGDGDRTIELYEVGPLHCKEMVIAYLPKEKILFQSDLFNPIGVNELIEHDAPFHGVYDDNPAQLYRKIRELRLDIRTIAGSHGRVGTFEELAASVHAADNSP